MFFNNTVPYNLVHVPKEPLEHDIQFFNTKKFYHSEAHVESNAWNPEGDLPTYENPTNYLWKGVFHSFNMTLWNNLWI